MKCHFVLCLLFCFNVNFLILDASLVEINETTFARLPPLNALDDWTQCREPGDRYCVVDAALLSDGYSETLELLQNYSRQTLKHYNRTVIHRGVCVRHCTERTNASHNATGGWQRAVHQCVNDTVFEKYGLQASVYSIEGCSAGPGSASGPGSATGLLALNVLCITLLVLAVLATSLHVIADKCAKGTGVKNRFLMAFSLKRNWSILTYDRCQPGCDPLVQESLCMEGFRVAGTQCVIFAHVMFLYVSAFTDNPHYVEKMFDQLVWQTVFSSPLWLQGFLALTAFLMTYKYLVASEKRPFTVLQALTSIVDRWVRLTPVAVFALWVSMCWLGRAGAGAQWWWLVGREAAHCSERWWHHVIYTHNHLPTGKFCMGHTWYLAVDMQLYIFGTILMFLLLRVRSLVWPLLAVTMTASMAAAGVVTYLYQLTPIATAQAPESVRSLFAGSRVVSLLYVPSYMNLPGFVCGMAVAFILHRNKKRGVDLSTNTLFNLAYHLSLTLGSVVVMSGSFFLQDAPAPWWANVAYAALDRTLVALCFCVFMLGSLSGCKSAVKSMLSHRGLQPLGRLSYSAFVLHFMVMRAVVASEPSANHASIAGCVSLLISGSVLTYLVSIPVCLLVELPCIQLWKAILRVERNSTRPATPVVEDRVKPFDLVAHVGQIRGQV